MMLQGFFSSDDDDKEIEPVIAETEIGMENRGNLKDYLQISGKIYSPASRTWPIHIVR